MKENNENVTSQVSASKIVQLGSVKTVKRPGGKQGGAAIMEYALLAVLIAAASTVAVQSMGVQIGKLLASATSVLHDARPSK